MKYILLIITLTLLLACHRQGETAAVRRIINETSYDVSFSVYGGSADTFAYQVPALDTLEIAGSCFCCPQGYCILGWGISYPEAEIRFDTLRVQRFEGLPADPDIKSLNFTPFDDGFGYESSEEDKAVIYTYHITPEDFAAADTL